jgi:hypothetical protein
LVVVFFKTEGREIFEYFKQKIENQHFFALLEQSEVNQPVVSYVPTFFEQFPDISTVFALSMFVGIIVVTVYFGGSSGNSGHQPNIDAYTYSRLLMEAEAYKYSDSIGTYVDSLGPVVPGITG